MIAHRVGSGSLGARRCKTSNTTMRVPETAPSAHGRTARASSDPPANGKSLGAPSRQDLSRQVSSAASLQLPPEPPQDLRQPAEVRDIVIDFVLRSQRTDSHPEMIRQHDCEAGGGEQLRGPATPRFRARRAVRTRTVRRLWSRSSRAHSRPVPDGDRAGSGTRCGRSPGPSRRRARPCGTPCDRRFSSRSSSRPAPLGPKIQRTPSLAPACLPVD